MVIMNKSSACDLAPTLLSAVYGGQYVPPSSTMYPGMVHTRDGAAVYQQHSGVSPYISGGNAVPSVSTSHSYVPGLPVAMTYASYPSLTSYPAPYSYASLTSGIGATPSDVAYTDMNTLHTTKAADILGMDMTSTQPESLEKSRKFPHYWRKKTVEPPQGMTRTRDKYRVVYSSKQRAGLEKEYNNNKFLTCARRTDISKTLDLSERQIKIWFQNRRAKERRQSKRSEETNRMSSPEMLDKHSGISGDEGEHVASAISPNHGNMEASVAEHALYGQFTAHARQYQLPSDTHVDLSIETIRPSCQFAFRPVDTLAEQLYQYAVFSKPSTAKEPVINSSAIAPQEYKLTFHYGNDAAFLTPSQELQQMNRLMTSYNFSPIGVNTDTSGVYRV